MHRGKNLLVTPDVARLLDPICRAETDRMRAADPAGGGCSITSPGPALSPEEVRAELRLKRQELTALRVPLERCGAIVSRPVEMTRAATTPAPRPPARRELARWDQVYLGPPADADPGQSSPTCVAGVRAAVIAPEREMRRWFSWPWYWTDTLVDDLIAAGRLRRLDAHVSCR